MNALLMVAAAVLATGCSRDPELKPTDDPKKRLAALEKRMGEAAMTAAGCRFEAPKLQTPNHVESISDVKYTSDPPTSGKHYDEWGAWGFYDKPMHDGNAIHHLEHGGVVLWYGDSVTEKQLKVIEEDVLDSGEKWVVTPRDGIDGFAAAGWGQLFTCDSAATAQLTDDELVEVLDAWYDAANSQGAEGESEMPAYAGALKDPQPTKDISIES
jgi:hypothetical protein